MKYGAIFGWIMKIGIVGYGNLGKALEKIAVENNTEIVGIFTRREPCKVISPYKSKVYSFVDVCDFAGAIDVLLLCVGSKSDLVGVAEQVANKFNTVDSFDTHAKIPEYADFMRRTVTDKLSYISIGWDPGLFSLMRALFSAILPSGEPSTFWGKGVSQGHGEAIRRIKGVKNAVQYTVPKQSAIDAVMSGQGKNLSERDKHLRQCYVVLEDGANGDEIEKQSKICHTILTDMTRAYILCRKRSLKKSIREWRTAVLCLKKARFAAMIAICSSACKLSPIRILRQAC